MLSLLAVVHFASVAPFSIDRRFTRRDKFVNFTKTSVNATVDNTTSKIQRGHEVEAYTNKFEALVDVSSLKGDSLKGESLKDDSMKDSTMSKTKTLEY